MKHSLTIGTQASLRQYTYPGPSDKQITKLIKRIQPYDDYWHRSEEYVFSFVDKILQSKTRENFLDLGCGQGRLTKRFDQFFKNIVAIDPDPIRLKIAQDFNDDSSQLTNKKFICGDVNELNLPTNHFDVILISHVIQHIHTDDVDKVLMKVYELLKPGGLLILTTSHSRDSDNRFIKTNKKKNGRFRQKTITQNAYNSYITNQQGILPVHLFSITDLRKRLDKYKILAVKVFHILKFPEIFDAFIFRDRMVNNFLPKKFFGTDILLIAKK
jgi:ubiquinone/menaquinone biosynthesis C-methylase UbiE